MRRTLLHSWNTTLAMISLYSKLIRRHVTRSVAANPPSEKKPVFNFGPALNRRTLVIPGNVDDARVSFTGSFKNQGYIQHWFRSGMNPALPSGGIWVNRSGESVGIQYGRLIGDQSASSSGLSTASPPKAIRQLIKDLWEGSISFLRAGSFRFRTGHDDGAPPLCAPDRHLSGRGREFEPSCCHSIEYRSTPPTAP